MELLGLVFLGLLFSFFFAGFETGFISLDYLLIIYFAEIEHSFIFKNLKKMYKKKELVLAVILIGNNLSIISSTFIFSYFLEKNMFGGVEHSDFIKVVLSMGVLSPLFFIFGEIVPKLLFRTYPYKLIKIVFPVFLLVYYILLPLGYLFYIFSLIIMKILSKFHSTENIESRYKIFNFMTKEDKISKIINMEERLKSDFFVKISDDEIYDSNDYSNSIPYSNGNILFLKSNGELIGFVDNYKLSKKKVRLKNIMKNFVYYKNQPLETIISLIDEEKVILYEKDNDYYYLDKTQFLLNLVL